MKVSVQPDFLSKKFLIKAVFLFGLENRSIVSLDSINLIFSPKPSIDKALKVMIMEAAWAGEF